MIAEMYKLPAILWAIFYAHLERPTRPDNFVLHLFSCVYIGHDYFHQHGVQSFNDQIKMHWDKGSIGLAICSCDGDIQHTRVVYSVVMWLHEHANHMLRDY